MGFALSGMQIKSDAFEQDGLIPARFTGKEKMFHLLCHGQTLRREQRHLQLYAMTRMLRL